MKQNQTGGGGNSGGGGGAHGSGGTLGTQAGVNPAAAPDRATLPGAQLSALSAAESSQAQAAFGSAGLGSTPPAVNAQALGFGASQITGMAAPAGFGSFSFGTSLGASSSGTAPGFRRRSKRHSVNGNARRQQLPAASQVVFGSGNPISMPRKDDNVNTNPEKMVKNISTRMGDEHVLERILDGAEDPTNLPLALLEKITGNFSEERKIGQGGFGDVYKGVKRIDENVYTVAVKRIHINGNTIDDKSFRREVTSLMELKHQNVVRFLGFCSNTHCESKKHADSGEMVWVNVLERLLCLEYIDNGSLDKHITDELRGFEWETRYEIITGICKGICYLHEEKNIVHMDLKPANILLDGQNMVPKITDFGLSRPNKNTHTMAQPIGTRGYIAPEYEKYGKTSFKSDIYSLGAIIIELVTGRMEVPREHNVLRRWRHRWRKPPTLLQYQQVIRCIDIAERCREKNPEHRPSIKEIIDILSECGSSDEHSVQESTYLDDDMLRIEPLELHFTFKHNKEVSWSVKLTNETKASFAFNIERPSKQYTIRPDRGIVPPECNEYLVHITLQPEDSAQQVSQNADKFVVQSTTVSNDLRVEDITEHIFHEEVHKVVDEVDLMVVYEPTRPQENCKNREDINTPVEEVSKAKNRYNVESASEKGKNKVGTSAEAASVDINSSARGQCVGKTEQCNLHTLQSFSRHYPTNRKYLWQESDRAVDSARGALGSLLDKLGKLVAEDYSLDTSIKSDIESFSVDLEMMHQILPKLDNVARAKIWVDEVRELSYNIEDMVDSFLVHVEPDSSRCGFRELTREGLKLLLNGMPTHRLTGDVIRGIKDKVQDVAEKGKKYNFDVKHDVANAPDKAAIDDLRNLAIYKHKEQLVGIKAPRDELIRLLQKDDDASKGKLKILSIVGMGGLGKTTLAKAVYDKLKAYHPKAFVPVGQNPNVETVLKKILLKFQEDFNAQNLDNGDLIETLQKFLKDKRYFIVIDDIWDSTAWGLINSAFPRNKRGSIIITTTRIFPVARACCNDATDYVYRIKPLSEEESRSLFFRRAFGPEEDCPGTTRKKELLNDILKTCGGMPLAINSIASLLAGEEDTTWENVWKSLGALTEGKTDLDNMKQILDLSYIHLPNDLKTCLLYVCKYPEDSEINKNDLLRQWIAEGLVCRKGRLDAEDVAENSFKALINMCMIEPGKIDYNNEVLSCRVLDLILDLIRSRSIDVNFIHVIDGSKDEMGARGEIRRVSVHYKDKDNNRIFETMKGSLEHVRSVVHCCPHSFVPYFLEFKYVRVLHLEYEESSFDPIDLTGINRLFLLRYFKFRSSGSKIVEFKLPDQIGQLQQLETVDLEGGILKNHPSDFVSLPWLSHLSYSQRYGIALPEGIDKLKSLRTLVGVCVHQSSVDSIIGLGKLTNLRRLHICPEKPWHRLWSEEVNSMRMTALHSSICKLSASLRILSLGENQVIQLDVRGWSKSLFPQVSNIRELDLGRVNFHRCPEWIGQLNGLYKLTIGVWEVADGVSIVAMLPSLVYFRLSIEDHLTEYEKEESVVISGRGAFQALKHLDFYCKKASLTFEEGVLPKLEKLEIGFHDHMSRRFLPVGIEHLPAGTLKEINLSVPFVHVNYKVDDSIVAIPEDSDSDEWGDYFHLQEVKQAKKLKHLLKRAFKPHHPAADINIYVRGDYSDYESVDDEENCCSEEDDKDVDDEEDNYNEDGKGAYQVSGSHTSAHVQPSTRKVELIGDPPGGLVDLNQVPNQLNDEELPELNEDVEPTSINCSSCIHAAANLCFIILIRIKATCNSCLRS